MQAPQLYARLGGDAGRLAVARQLVLFAVSLVAFVILDGIWIGLVASDFYNSRLAGILKPVDPAAAALSWICIVGINQVFVLPRTVSSPSPYNCLAQGALMGALLYGTVDLTNCALLSGWSWLVAGVDMAWGTTACAALGVVQNRLHAWLASGAPA